jgi:RNA polymerase sigma-70 factor (ECF subfamily)
MESSDHELLKQYRRGRVDALEALVDKYRRPLYSFILNMTEGRDDADEIFQEVWLRVIRKIGLYRDKNFFGWLVRITRNLIIDRARRRKPSLSLDADPEDGHSLMETVEGDGPTPADRLGDDDIGRRIKEAVHSLPDEQKEVFLMRVNAELPFKEIARLQKVSINTALARMHYALAKLRPLLQVEYAALGRH